MTQLRKVKVTVHGHGFYPLIVSALYLLSWILWLIFIELHPNVPLRQMVCRAHDSATQAQSQGITL